ncbi:MAG: PorT family protein, partial [Flavobacterium sp.]
MKKLLITAVLLATCSIATAQYGYRDANRIGFSVGVNQFTMNSNDFESKPGIGWTAGLSVRGNFYNDFDMVYEIHFSENQFQIEPENPLGSDVKCKIQSAQIALL